MRIFRAVLSLILIFPTLLPAQQGTRRGSEEPQLRGLSPGQTGDRALPNDRNALQKHLNKINTEKAEAAKAAAAPQTPFSKAQVDQVKLKVAEVKEVDRARHVATQVIPESRTVRVFVLTPLDSQERKELASKAESQLEAKGIKATVDVRSVPEQELGPDALPSVPFSRVETIKAQLAEGGAKVDTLDTRLVHDNSQNVSVSAYENAEGKFLVVIGHENYLSVSPSAQWKPVDPNAVKAQAPAAAQAPAVPTSRAAVPVAPAPVQASWGEAAAPSPAAITATLAMADAGRSLGNLATVDPAQPDVLKVNVMGKQRPVNITATERTGGTFGGASMFGAQLNARTPAEASEILRQPQAYLQHLQSQSPELKRAVNSFNAGLVEAAKTTNPRELAAQLNYANAVHEGVHLAQYEIAPRPFILTRGDNTFDDGRGGPDEAHAYAYEAAAVKEGAFLGKHEFARTVEKATKDTGEELALSTDNKLLGTTRDGSRTVLEYRSQALASLGTGYKHQELFSGGGTNNKQLASFISAVGKLTPTQMNNIEVAALKLMMKDGAYPVRPGTAPEIGM